MPIATSFDTTFAAAQFAQHQADFVFCANAGGSFIAKQVSAILTHYHTHHRVQPYSGYAASVAAGRAMDRAIAGWAEALNITSEELTIGPSTSLNTYTVAHAIGATLTADDEIIVTNQDHEANSGVWRQQAERTGARLREWRVAAETGLLASDDLLPLLNARTRWVFFPHCSNIIGGCNPVREIVRVIQAHSPARVFVDAVAYAPHEICDLRALEVDGYAFSLYKVFGPHQGLMYLRRAVAEALPPQCHFFNTDDIQKRFESAGPQHAEVAACAGVLDYFDALYAHHFGDAAATQREKLQALHTLLAAHEARLTEPLVEFLHAHPDVRLLGKSHTRDHDRAPTIAFYPYSQSPDTVARAMHKLGIGCESGHFYAWRLLTDLGLDATTGVVRISLVHYNTAAEVTRIITALEQVLARGA